MTVLEFDGVEIEGDLIRPTEHFIIVRKGTFFFHTVQPRGDFVFALRNLHNDL